MDVPDQNEARDRVVKQAFQCREALEVYAFGMLRNRAESEDVVQDAFLVVMEKYKAFEEGTPMLAWTRSIVRYKVLQALDRRKHRVKVIDRLLTDAVDAALTDVDSGPYTDEVIIRRRQLENCLSRLSDQPRTLLNCVYTTEMSYGAAAESLGLTVETVRKGLYRAKRQLRVCLGRETKGSAA